MKKFLPAIISLTIFIIFIMLPFDVINKNFTLRANDGTNLDETTFKGRTIQAAMYKESSTYPIFGSSELKKVDPFHPVNVFSEMNVNVKPFLIGEAGSTDLIHAINVASQVGNMEHKKMAIIISPQWFTNTGIDDNNFTAKYSPLQISYLISNPTLSTKLKKQFATRLLDFSATKDDEKIKQVANIDLHQDVFTKDVPSLEFDVSKKFLEKNDYVKSVLPKSQRNFKTRDVVNLKDKTWSELRHIAADYGKSHATNNKYFMKNWYYKKIMNHQKKLKRDNEFYVNSKEFEDLDLLMQSLKEAKADPLFIVLPTNGKWYDHIGIGKERRQVVFNKITKQIEQSGFHMYDMSSKEYEPYVINDAVHIGWKGWVYADEAMVNHINDLK